MKILVTGASGFIGSRLCELLHEHSIVKFEGDVTNRQNWEREISWLNKNRPDAVIHLAAMTSLVATEQDPVMAFDVNFKATLLAAEAARKLGARFVLASTVTVQGVTYDPDARYAEAEICDPVTVYDATKYAAEASLFRDFHAVILRLSNVYGISPAPTGGGRSVLNNWCKLGLNGKPIIVHSLAANCIRDYVYLDDVVAAFELAVTSKIHGVFNVCSGVGTRVLDAAELCGEAIVEDYVPDLPSISKRSWTGDNSALKKLGWKPAVSLQDGIERTQNYLIGAL